MRKQKSKRVLLWNVVSISPQFSENFSISEEPNTKLHKQIIYYIFNIKSEFPQSAAAMHYRTFYSFKQTSNPDQFVFTVHKAYCVNSLVFSGEQILISVAQVGSNSPFQTTLWKPSNRHVCDQVRNLMQNTPHVQDSFN